MTRVRSPRTTRRSKPGAEGSPLRRWVFRIVAIVGGLGLASLLLEVVFRIAGIDGTAAPPRRLEALTHTGEWKVLSVWGTSGMKRESPFAEVAMGEYIPELTTRFAYFDSRASAQDGTRPSHVAVNRINQHGLRGKAIAKVKPSETYRILFLGDSFTFGEGVGEDETFCSRIETSLNAFTRGRPRIEVMNAGVSGYNTRDEVAYLERRWLEFGPDLVIVVFYLNDAYDDARFAPLITGMAQGALDIGLTGHSSSRVLEWFSHARTRWRLSREIVRLYQAQFSDQPVVGGSDWVSAKDALRRARQLTAERGIPLGLVIFPELYQLDARHPFVSVYQAVHAHAVSLEIPVLNLFDTFRGRPDHTLWVHPTDHHPNARAHELAGKAIRDFIEGTFLDGVGERSVSGATNLLSAGFARPALARPARSTRPASARASGATSACRSTRRAARTRSTSL